MSKLHNGTKSFMKLKFLWKTSDKESVFTKLCQIDLMSYHEKTKVWPKKSQISLWISEKTHLNTYHWHGFVSENSIKTFRCIKFFMGSSSHLQNNLSRMFTTLLFTKFVDWFDLVNATFSTKTSKT